VAVWSGVNNPAATALLSPPLNPGFVYANGDTYDAGLGYAGIPSTRYKVCWSFNPTSGGGIADYKVDVGQFTMNGAVQDVVGQCTLGQSCNLIISGTGLSETNQVKIVMGPGLCGSSSITAAVLQ
ncbi:unnamed protein product, partial [Polarella glacialis]